MSLPEPVVRDRTGAMDVILGLVVTAFGVLPYLPGGGDLATLALSAMLGVSVMFRRSVPALAITLAAIACLGQLVLLREPTTSLVAVPILIYSIARWTTGVIGRITLWLGLVGSVLGPLRWSLTYGVEGRTGVYGVAMIMACVAGVAAIYVVGRRRRETQENTQQRKQSEAERERLMLAEQQQRERSITVEERTRIARELHDIVAHSLSVIVVQAEGGRALAGKHPEQAGEVLGTIAETSREALDEMRRMVLLLRSGGPEPEHAVYVPTPGLADIPELVRKTSETAQLSTFGPTPRVSQALGLSAYRIVQESLTNVLKHAGPDAVARVSVAYTPGSIELEISDDGRGAAASTDSLGHGLQGMRERVALHGGSLITEPRSPGFGVRASLPYAHEPGFPDTLINSARPSLIICRSVTRCRSRSSWSTTSPWSAAGSGC